MLTTVEQVERLRDGELDPEQEARPARFSGTPVTAPVVAEATAPASAEAQEPKSKSFNYRMTPSRREVKATADAEDRSIQ